MQNRIENRVAVESLGEVEFDSICSTENESWKILLKRPRPWLLRDTVHVVPPVPWPDVVDGIVAIDVV